MLLLEEADEARPINIGKIDEAGRLMTEMKLLQLPGSATFEAAGFGPFKAGDEVTFVECDDYHADRWLLVETSDNERVIVHAKTIDGVAHLVNHRGDEIRYRKDRHRVVGLITSRRERM